MALEPLIYSILNARQLNWLMAHHIFYLHGGPYTNRENHLRIQVTNASLGCADDFRDSCIVEDMRIFRKKLFD